MVAAAVPLALFVPDGDFRAMDNAPFGPAIAAAAEHVDDLERILAHLGRSPQWQPTVGSTRRGGRSPLVVVPAGDRR